MKSSFEKIFPKDELTKPERVLRTLRHQPVDRVAIHDHLAYHPGVISMLTGKAISGYNYTLKEIGEASSKVLDMCFPFAAPCGTDLRTDKYGFVSRNDNWTRWRVSRPFADEHGAAKWLGMVISDIKAELGLFDANAYREGYIDRMREYRALVGETVILDICTTGFCDAFDRMGLEIYSYFQEAYSDMLLEYMEVSTELAVRRANAAACAGCYPAVLIAEDFSAKHGPIFGPSFLRQFHFPYVKRLAKAWRDHGIFVIYHSDGHYKPVIPDLIACGVDGFYCLEKNAGMDIVALKAEYPQMVWAGGVDGVDLMERGSPEDVAAEVRRQIAKTDALRAGGMFLASSSEISPTIRPENFLAMIDAADAMRNPRSMAI